MKVILGAGGARHEGWFSTEKPELDITDEASFRQYFGKFKADAFLAEHVWEHLSLPLGLQAAKLCHAFLKPGGRLRIAVPDGLNPDPVYIEWVRPGGNGPGADDHHVLYDRISLCSMLSSAGFHQVIPLEWWDDSGIFQSIPWNREDGFIGRSLHHDARNAGGVIRYTSLIVDALKSPA